MIARLGLPAAYVSVQRDALPDGRRDQAPCDCVAVTKAGVLGLPADRVSTS